MKTYALGFGLIGLTALMTGCGAQAECNSSDVQETYLGMVGNLREEGAAEVLKSSEFESVVTKEKDESTGARFCAARIVMENEAGSDARDISYQVEQVESGESSFQVYGDRNDLGRLSLMANSLAKKARVKKKTAEMEEEVSADPYVQATEEDAQEAAIAVGHRFFGSRLDESSVRIIPMDVDGDGVMEFVAGLKKNYSDGGGRWHAVALHQFPTGPGQKNAVQFSGEGAIEVLDSEPSGYALEGGEVRVTTVDGARELLVHHTSTQAYRIYINLNANR